MKFKKSIFSLFSVLFFSASLFAAQPSLVVVAPQSAAQAVAQSNGKAVSKKTPLASAAKKGERKTVKELIAGGAQANERDERGNTALHYAAKYGHDDVVADLLKNGANPDAKNKIGQTPLVFAATFLATKKITPNAAYEAIAQALNNASQALGALMQAAKMNDKDTAKKLLDGGLYSMAQDNTGNTPLHITAKNGSPHVAALLIQQGADKNIKNSQGATALVVAENELSTVISSIATAAQADKPELDKKQKNLQNVIAVLKKATSPRQTRTSSPNTTAQNDEQSKAVLLDLKAHAQKPLSPEIKNLFDMARSGSLDDLKAAAAHKADFNAQDSDGNTLLHSALLANRPDEIIEFIIKKMSSYDTPNKDGDRPLHIAARTIRYSSAQMLIHALADRAPKNQKGDTPLHIVQRIYANAPEKTELEKAEKAKMKKLMDYLSKSEKELKDQEFAKQG